MASRITTPIRRERETSRCRDFARVSLGALESGKIVLGIFINYETSIVAPASAKISFRRHLGQSMLVMENDQHEVFRHRKLPPLESSYHKGQRLDRLKDGYPTRRPHLRPRRIRRKQLHFQEYCYAMFCARASSPLRNSTITRSGFRPPDCRQMGSESPVR
jgi:hypothetical protein